MSEEKKAGRKVVRISIAHTKKSPASMLRIILKTNKRTFKYLSNR